MDGNTKRGNFSSQIGFILAAAGSAIGLGNIWRFPYLAAKDGGGVFLLCYIILALTFGFTLLTTEIAIGRKTRQSPLTAYSRINRKFGFIGVFACIVPVMILPYYCAIGGWVLKYLETYITLQRDAAAQDNYFTGFISGNFEPIIYMLIFFAITAFVVFSGIEKGIERYSKILMPILLLMIIGISIYSLTISHTDDKGKTVTGVDGLLKYIVPDFTGMTFGKFMIVIMDALGQLFYSISVAMGIMITYGSYAKKETNLMKSINQIEFFDTLVAFLAGMMIIPAVLVFSGPEGMSVGPGLMFVSLPKVFHSMGIIGSVVGLVFFLIVTFAAVTSSVSIMEAIVSCLMDKFGWSRKKSAVIVSIYSVIFGIIVCLGYNLFYFEMELPNGVVGQILDLMDYISNNWLMPVVALLTCILIGWIAKPKVIIDEVTQGKYKFQRKWLYIVMVKFVAPTLLFILLLQAFGIFNGLQ